MNVCSIKEFKITSHCQTKEFHFKITHGIMIISIILTALFLKIKLHMKYNWVELLSFLKAVELWFKSFYEEKKVFMDL